MLWFFKEKKKKNERKNPEGQLASEERFKKCRGLSHIAGNCQHLAWTTKSKRRMRLHPLGESMREKQLPCSKRQMDDQDENCLQNNTNQYLAINLPEERSQKLELTSQ